MIPIYKICSACLGEGEVEDLNMKNPKIEVTTERLIEKPSEKPRVDKCIVCGGDGYIPTGHFMLEKDELLRMTFAEKLEQQPDNIKRAIINNKI